jgi:hypothetical protein
MTFPALPVRRSGGKAGRDGPKGSAGILPSCAQRFPKLVLSRMAGFGNRGTLPNASAESADKSRVLWGNLKVALVRPAFCQTEPRHRGRTDVAAIFVKGATFCVSSVVARVLGRAPSGGDGQYGKAKGDHHQTDKLEGKRVHENFPQRLLALSGSR